MRQCVVVELVPLRGEKILRHAHKPGPWYLCISFRTTAHREWSTLVTARLPVARLTILDRLVYFQTNKPDGEQKSFMVNFSGNSDVRQGFKASLRDFWDKDISKRTAESHRYVFGRYRCLHFVTNWLWKIFNISSSASDRSPLFSLRNRSLYLLYRPLKLSLKTRCTILMYLGQEDCPPSTFGLFENGAANLLRPCLAAGPLVT